MNRMGINQGTSGNISARVPMHNKCDSFLITPSGVPYSDLTPEMLIMIKIDDAEDNPTIIQGPSNKSSINILAPSSEWRLHRDIYCLKTSAQAVVHAHPTFSTILSCLHINIPSFHYMIAVAGGSDIRCTPYHTFGTKALAEAMKDALNERYACLLGNHGMIAFSEKSVNKALSLAIEVEALAKQYYHVLQLTASFGNVVRGSNEILESPSFMLDENEMKIIKEKFKKYGQSVERS